jgi:hypothetical protein
MRLHHGDGLTELLDIEPDLSAGFQTNRLAAYLEPLVGKSSLEH